jgi:hypothetical protein
MRTYREWTVVITMITRGMMQPSADQIVNVVTIWNGLMTAVGAMPMD